MRIAIAAENSSMDARISDRGGRAPYYLIFENKELVESIKNPFAVGGGGAGWSVAYMLAERNVDLVIVGRIGPNMQRALEENNVRFIEMPGRTVIEALEGIQEKE